MDVVGWNVWLNSLVEKVFTALPPGERHLRKLGLVKMEMEIELSSGDVLNEETLLSALRARLIEEQVGTEHWTTGVQLFRERFLRAGVRVVE